MMQAKAAILLRFLDCEQCSVYFECINSNCYNFYVLGSPNNKHALDVFEVKALVPEFEWTTDSHGSSVLHSSQLFRLRLLQVRFHLLRMN